MLDVPVTFNAKDFELDQPDIEKVTELFNELEFRNLLVQLSTRTFSASQHWRNKKRQQMSASSAVEKSDKESTLQMPATNKDGQFDLFAAPGTAGSVSDEASCIWF